MAAERATVRRWLRRTVLTFAGLGLALAVTIACLPVVGFHAPTSHVLRDREGRILAGAVASDGQWRFGVPDELPERYRVALLAFEDARFHQHPGVDPLAIARAAIGNLRAGEVVSGASTLTMQVVRLSRPRQPRGWRAKVIEAALALRLELAHDKRHILRLYAAHAPFGGNTVGLEAAAWRYYGRPARDLTWGEAATLAVLPNSPGLMHPGRNRGALAAKRDRLLVRLHQQGHIDEQTLVLARAEPLPAAPRPLARLASHLLFTLAPHHAGVVTTTIDGPLQRQTLDVLRRHQQRLAANGIHNLAAIIIDNDHGAVRAYHGNVLVDGGHEDHVDMAQAPRSTGSLLKPFIHEALMARGALLPEQLVPDIPVALAGFTPENFGKSWDGAVPAGQALARSLNVPAVLALQELGVPNFLVHLRALGVTTMNDGPERYGVALALGGAEGRLIELGGLYASLARAARGLPLRRPWIVAAKDGRHATDLDQRPLEPASAYLTLQALLEAERPGIEASWRDHARARRVAWKTGTSQGHRDGWAIGATPGYTVAVWAGNADGEGRSGLTGHKAAAPVLFELFDLLPREPWFTPPPSLQPLTVCAHSGMKAGPACAHKVMRQVAPAALESAPCQHCRIVHLAPDREVRVNSRCARVATMRQAAWFALPTEQEALYRRRHPEYRPLPAWAAGCEDTDGEDAGGLAILRPQAGARLAVPRLLDGQRGSTVFAASHRDPEARLHWHLDDTYLGTTQGFHDLEVAPTPGEHALTLVDERGNRVERRFEVLDGAGE